VGSRGSKKKKINNNNLVDPTRNFEKIIKNLQIHEYMAVISFVESEVNKRSLEIENRFNKQLEVITKALDRNMTASMILKTNYSLDAINDIFKYTWELIDEDNKKVEVLKKEGNGDWMKEADKYVELVQERAAELINNKVNQKKSVETLVMEFPKLSKSMITNAYKKAKELIEENKILKAEIEEDPEAVKLYKAIYGEDDFNPSAIKEAAEELKEKKVEVEEVNKVDKEIKEKQPEAKEESKIKVVKMELIGEFGVYEVEGTKLTIDDVKFDSREHLEDVYKKQIEYLTKCKDEAIKVYEMVEKVS